MPVREASRVGAPHAGVDGRVRAGRRGARHRGDHRRRRRRRAPAGHGRRAHACCRCSACRCRAPRCRASTRCCRSCRCRAACRSARWPSARPGATNAGLLAVGILATTRPELREQLRAVPRRADREGARRTRCREPHRAARRHASACWAAASSAACSRIAARRMGYRVHTLSPDDDTPTGQVADVEVSADYDDLDAIRAFARGVDVVTFEFENVSTDAADAAAEIVPVRPSGLGAAHHAAARAREGVPRRSRLPGHAVRARRSRSTSWPIGARRGRPAGGPQDRGVRLRRQGPAPHRSHRATAERVWGADRPPGGDHRALRRLHARDLGGRGARARRRVRALRRDREHAPQPHPRPDGVRRRACPPAIAGEAVHARARVLEELDYVGVLCVEFFLTQRRRGCWSTSSRRGRTTPATSRSTPA